MQEREAGQRYRCSAEERAQSGLPSCVTPHPNEFYAKPKPPRFESVLEALNHNLAELHATLAQLQVALARSPERPTAGGDAETHVRKGEALSSGMAQQHARSPASDGLTPRQTDVLELLATGLSNGEIAQRLRLSLNTVERHVSNVYLKVGARNRVDAANYALTRQALPPDLNDAPPIEGIP